MITLFNADRIRRLEEFGEDSRDLVRTIELSFGFEFSADELIAAETIKELSDCISKRIGHEPSRECLSAVVFDQLRRAFIDLFDIPRNTVRSDTLLTELMPWTVRKSRWYRLQRQLAVKLPQLVWPHWLLCLSSAIVVGIATLDWTRLTSKVGELGGVLVAFLVWAIVLRLLSPLARAFPGSCETFSDLVRLTLARNYSIFAFQRGKSSTEEILVALRQLIAAETGIDMKRITSETSFPSGLNIY